MSMNNLNDQNRSAKEPATSKMMRYVGIASSLLIVGGVAYFGWGAGTREATDVPVVDAIEGNIRTSPENAGGETVDYQGNQVNGVLEGNPPALTDNLALAPDPSDLNGIDPAVPSETVLGSVDGSQSTNDETEVVILNTDLPSVASPIRRPELLYIPPQDRLNPLTLEARPIGGGTVAPVAVASATDIVVTDELPDISTPSSAQTVQEVQVAIPEPRPVTEETVVIEEPIIEAPEEAAPAEVAPEVVAPVEVVEAPQTAPSGDSELGPRLPSGTPLIQLAANLTLIDTQNQWTKLKSTNASLLGSKSLYVEKKSINGKVWYRLRVSGFANGAEAQATCATLNAKNVQCLYVKSE